MSKKSITDLLGKQFSRLLVKGQEIRVEEKKGFKTKKIYRKWCLVQCDCGSEPFWVQADSLIYERTKSCGCFASETRSFMNVAEASRSGLSNTRIYQIWRNIYNRCYNYKNPSYRYYGGRGIKLQPSWIDDFYQFASDAIIKGYKEGMVIDRIDRDKNFTYENTTFIYRVDRGDAIPTTTGNKYGRLIVLEEKEEQRRTKSGKLDQKRRYALVKCSCGSEPKWVDISGLHSGKVTSCGCIQKQKARLMCHERNKHNHGLSHTVLHKKWRHIKDRCFNPNTHNFNRYGGRGITMCDQWSNDFMAFYFYCLEHGYQDNLQIDRINNDGNYEPGNIRFVDRIVQNNNRSNNIIIEYNSKQQTLSQWAEELDIPYKTLHARIMVYKWSIEKALTFRKKPLT